MNIFRSASALVAVLYLCPVAHAMGGRSATPEELQQFDAEFGPAFRKMQAANEEYGRELQERMRRRLAGVFGSAATRLGLPTPSTLSFFSAAGCTTRLTLTDIILI